MRKHSETVESAGWLAVKALLYTACGGNSEGKTVFNVGACMLIADLLHIASDDLCH